MQKLLYAAFIQIHRFHFIRNSVIKANSFHTVAFATFRVILNCYTQFLYKKIHSNSLILTVLCICRHTIQFEAFLNCYTVIQNCYTVIQNCYTCLNIWISLEYHIFMSFSTDLCLILHNLWLNLDARCCCCLFLTV